MRLMQRLEELLMRRPPGSAAVDLGPHCCRRRKQNESKWSFYELKLSARVDIGIGVTGEAKTVAGGLDLNGDGAPEKFTQCASSEGVWFRVWSGPAYQGTPLWSGYYYLGYDAEVTCPS